MIRPSRCALFAVLLLLLAVILSPAAGEGFSVSAGFPLPAQAQRDAARKKSESRMHIAFFKVVIF